MKAARRGQLTAPSAYIKILEISSNNVPLRLGTHKKEAKCKKKKQTVDEVIIVGAEINEME